MIEPRAILRGDEVTISLKNGGLALTAPGRALSDAARGEDLRVLNLSSNKTLTATTVGPGHVRVEN